MNLPKLEDLLWDTSVNDLMDLAQVCDREELIFLIARAYRLGREEALCETQ